MIDFLFLLLAVISLAYIIEKRVQRFENPYQGIHYDAVSKIIYITILVMLVLFAGLRTSYNDTDTYMQGFRILDAKNITLANILSPYGGFELFQKIIKTYISDDPQWMIFISAIVCVLLYIPFIVKRSKYLCGSMMLFMIGTYLFCMAGVKQSLAIGIVLYGIDFYFRKKYFRAILILLLAMSFHPYIICLACIPFLKKQIWNAKTLMVILVFVILFLNLENLLSLISLFGKNYSMETWNDYTINPMRVVVEGIPIFLSFIYRNRLNESNDELLILGTNMRLVSFAFIAMGLFFKPIYLGRMAVYFSSLSDIAIPKMLKVSFSRQQNGKLFILGYYAVFFVYCLLDMTKLGAINIFIDRFNHISLLSLF